MSEIERKIPDEVVQGVAAGLSYIIGPAGWSALPVVDVRHAEPPKPALTPLNAVRRLDAYYGENASEYINEALTVLWVHHMRESGLRK